MRKSTLAVLLLILFSYSFSIYESEVEAFTENEEENPVSVYALLFDQFVYDYNGSLMGSAIEFNDTLLSLGWPKDNVSLFLGEENMTKEIILEQLNYLEQVVDENDLVFIYIMAHGHTYCRDVLEFNSWFQTEFFQINTKNKIYLMDSCYAGEFVRNFYGDCFAMGSVGEEELAIAVLPQENETWDLSEPLFAGGISSHFWAKSLTNISADTSQDGVISLTEMYIHSLSPMRECYNETFTLNPDLAAYVLLVAGYTQNYPCPKVMNNLYYEITLNATEFILNNDKYVLDDDLEAPDILAEQVVYFSDETEIELSFQIRDQSAFNIYCYVDGQMDILASDSHSATGNEFWTFIYDLEVQPNKNYNVSVAVLDDCYNRNENFTLVIFDGETSKTSFEFGILAIGVFPIVAIYWSARKRKG